MTFEAPHNRLLIVANRLPITVTQSDGGLVVQRSSGGLVSGLQGPHERSNGLWIGWTGLATPLDEAAQRELETRLEAMRLVPVPLAADEVRRYYEGFSNGVLWPLFHYLLDQVPLYVQHWDAYAAVNERFADAVVAHYRPGDRIWIHDYQLLLLPALLRQRLPQARIGFFLHIPFPGAEVFRTLPMREQVLRGMLGADLIGFHTAGYLRHFSTSLTLVLGASPDIDRVPWEGREVRFGVFPMGVDATAFTAAGAEPAVQAEAASFRGADGVKLLLGIDRLDYTKGISRRLLAYERTLAMHPELRERVRLVQVSVPSRTGVEAYQEARENIDGLIGRIQGAFGTPRWQPVHYLYRHLSEAEVVALYRAADVMLVTPVRDGMNLVAKEFVATRGDGDGVLVLSEFAGAASELAEAVLVNPYDVDRTGEAIYRALTMDEAERRGRMAALRRRVAIYDIHRWTASFLDRLERIADSVPAEEPSAPPPFEPIRRAERLVLLLDYDGTLEPLTPTPSMAQPDDELRSLLQRLAARRGTQVHIVSGRQRKILEEWLGDLPVMLHAEHGLWSLDREKAEWTVAPLGDLRWREPVRAILQDFTARTPGALLEEKTAGFAWHYRMADAEFGDFQANELRIHLQQVLSDAPVEVLVGNKVIEVRVHGITKARVVAQVLSAGHPDAILAIGDDRTDEDLFTALPEDAVTVRVGPGPTRARYRLPSVSAVRGLLRRIAQTPPPNGK